MKALLKKYWYIFLLALLIRIILSAITYHSDIQAADFGGSIIASGNILNFYDYLYRLPEGHQILQTFPRYLFNYPPLVYFYFGLIQIFTFISSADFKQNFIFNLPEVLGTWPLYLHLLMLKLPYLFFDFGIIYILFNFFSEKRHKLAAAFLWLFNPINLYATYMMGQFDIIPTFCTLLSLYFASRNDNLSLKNFIFASIALGIGGAFKIYPLFLLIPLLSILPNWKYRFITGSAGFLAYLIPILPYIFSPGYRSTALVANQTLKSLYAQIPVSGGESIMLFVSCLVFLYLLFLSSSIFVTKNLWQRYFITLLIFFVFTHFHPQWLLWLTPFLIFDLVYEKFSTWPVVVLLLIVFKGMILFFDPGLSIGLFSAVNPTLYNTKSIWGLLGISLDINFYRSVLQSLFVGSALFYLYKYFKSAHFNQALEKE